MSKVKLFVAVFSFIFVGMIFAVPNFSFAQSNNKKEKLVKGKQSKAKVSKEKEYAAADDDTSVQSGFLLEHKSFMRLLYPSATNLKFSYQYQPTVEDEDGLGDSDKQQMVGEFDAIVPFDNDTFARVGLIYERSTYDMAQVLANSTESTNEILNHVGARFGFGNFVNDNVLISGFVDVGVFSDLDSGIETEDIRVHGEAITAYRINPGSQLLIGIRASDDIRTDSIYPMIGVRLMSTDGHLHLGLTVPFDARIGYNVSQDVELYARAWVQGYDYSAKVGNVDREVDIEIQDRRAGCGVVYWADNAVSMVLEFGVMLEGEFELKIKNPDSFHSDLETAPYARAALGFVF